MGKLQEDCACQQNEKGKEIEIAKRKKNYNY